MSTARLLISLFIILFLASLLLADEPPKALDRIVVTPSRLSDTSSQGSRSVSVVEGSESRVLPASAISDLVSYVGGIDMRRRGPEGVQADVSIRGTAFEQNSVLIDGVKVNDPQTGHFNMDLPLTSADLGRIEIMKGPASSLYGANSFGGVINVITKKPAGGATLFSIEGGSFDYLRSVASVTATFNRIFSNRFSVEESRSTGYRPETEFNILTVTNTLAADTPIGAFDFLFGYSKKDFGAADFYSNLFPNEKENTDTRFFKLGGTIEAGSLKFTPKLSMRRHKDKFALDANRPGATTNYHTTYTYAADIPFVFENEFAAVSYGIELGRDTIDSTSLQTHHINRGGAYIEVAPHLAECLYINIGMREDYFGPFGWEYSPTAAASYTPIDGLILRSSVGRAYRIPTFTDLYYNDSANIGNPDLRPESSWTYEAGLKVDSGITTIDAAVFLRNTADTIDWTRTATTRPWRASNIGTSETSGIELEADIFPGKAAAGSVPEKIFVKWTCLDVYAKHDYFSKYALDYLKQHITAGAAIDINGFKGELVLNYNKRIGDSGYTVVDFGVTKDIVSKGKLRFATYFSASNIFDVDYSEQSNIRMPGRWLKAGCRLEI